MQTYQNPPLCSSTKALASLIYIQSTPRSLEPKFCFLVLSRCVGVCMCVCVMVSVCVCDCVQINRLGCIECTTAQHSPKNNDAGMTCMILPFAPAWWGGGEGGCTLTFAMVSISGIHATGYLLTLL
jgi:hypothetical protein